MWELISIYSLFTLVVSVQCEVRSLESIGPPELKLCLYNNISYSKCQKVVEMSKEISLPLHLACHSRPDREGCLTAVRNGYDDMVILDEHDNHAGRKSGLKPVLFCKELWDNLHIVVAPRNITYVDYIEATLNVNFEDDRAVHAALFLNGIRGYETCTKFPDTNTDITIRVLNSNDYTPSEEQDILICPLSYAEPKIENIVNCNFEVSLQHAVFVNRRTKARKVRQIKRLFDRILYEFNASNEHFNFFAAYQGVNDVIFKDKTIQFDLEPTYLNGITEEAFEKLHCDGPDVPHNSDHLG